MFPGFANRFKKIEGDGRSVAQVLGSLLKTHYPGLVTRCNTNVAVPATRWEDYKLRDDTTHGTKYDAVLHDFGVSHLHYFFKHISSNELTSHPSCLIAAVL